MLDTEKAAVQVVVRSTTTALLSKKINCGIDILLVLKTNEIVFAEAQKTVFDYVTRYARDKIGSVKANWFICSDQGGIYLYEILAAKQNRDYSTMHNKIIILNSMSGSVSFGPGHRYNKGISEKVHALLMNHRYMAESKWVNDMFMLFDLSKEIIR